MELTEVTIKMDAQTLDAVQQGLRVLALNANTALVLIQSQVQEQLAASMKTETGKSNGHASPS